MKLKTFRGKLTSDDDQLEQNTIRLSTNKGQIGYMIKKFQVMPSNESDDVGAVIKIYTQHQANVDALVDFTDGTMLAVALYRQDSGNQYNFAQQVIFDAVKFNQDIYITYQDNETPDKTMNYYLELEQVNLSVDEAAVATLKDMRGRE